MVAGEKEDRKRSPQTSLADYVSPWRLHVVRIANYDENQTSLAGLIIQSASLVSTNQLTLQKRAPLTFAFASGTWAYYMKLKCSELAFSL